MMAMMNLDTTAGDLYFEEAFHDVRDPALVPQFTPLATARYSPQLRLMVQSCVKYLQRDRPTFKRLLDDVRSLALARGLRACIAILHKERGLAPEMRCRLV
jgi:hypothetical protein